MNDIKILNKKDVFIVEMNEFATIDYITNIAINTIMLCRTVRPALEQYALSYTLPYINELYAQYCSGNNDVVAWYLILNNARILKAFVETVIDNSTSTIIARLTEVTQYGKARWHLLNMALTAFVQMADAIGYKNVQDFASLNHEFESLMRENKTGGREDD